MPSKDDNGAPLLYGVSHEDGKNIVQIKFTSAGYMKVDKITAIQFTMPPQGSQTDNDVKLAKGVSSTDSTVVYPWVVNASTGAVLINIG